MNYSVYAKAIGNLCDRFSVKVANNEKDYLNMSANQLLLLQKSLIKIMLLFMTLNQF